MLELGNNPAIDQADFRGIHIPVLLLRGEKDAMVTEAETTIARYLLANGSYQEVAEWQHPINLVPSDQLVQQLLSSYLPG